MFLERLELTDYRNYEKAILEFEKPIVIILGMNGQGKTNILEAIYLLNTRTSFRARQQKEMILWGRPRSLVRGVISSNNKRDEIDIVVEAEGGLTLLKNKVKGKNREWEIPTVAFTPDDLQIIKGGPQGRRQYLDGVISKIKPAFLYALINYNRVLQQRNAFLKERKPQNNGEIEVWNEKLVVWGAKIILERERITQIINQKARVIYGELLEEKERKELALNYLSSVQKKENLEEIKKELIQELSAREQEEKERGLTLVGPHRDDLAITINGREARFYASQGEERSMVLTLKLSEVELLREEKGEDPLVLLDDVLSELDEEVKEKLTQRLSGRSQVFITTTNENCIPKMLGEAQRVWVEDGTIKEAAPLLRN